MPIAPRTRLGLDGGSAFPRRGTEPGLAAQEVVLV